MNIDEATEYIFTQPGYVITTVISRVLMRRIPHIFYEHSTAPEMGGAVQLFALRRLLVLNLASRDSYSDKLRSAFFDLRKAKDRPRVIIGRQGFEDLIADAIDLFNSNEFLSDARVIFNRAIEFSGNDDLVESSIIRDAEFINSQKENDWLIDQPLFPDGQNWSKYQASSIDSFKEHHQSYEFWVDWVKAVNAGEFDYFELAMQVAQDIPSTVWEAGSVPVAEKILKFQEEENSEKLSPQRFDKLGSSDQERIVKYVENLIRHPATNAAQYQLQAKLLKQTIESFHNESDPESIEYINQAKSIAVSFENTSKLLIKYKTKLKQRKATIEELKIQRAQLEGQVKALTAQLNRRNFAEALLSSAGAIILATIVLSGIGLSGGDTCKVVQDLGAEVEKQQGELSDDHARDLEIKLAWETNLLNKSLPE